MKKKLSIYEYMELIDIKKRIDWDALSQNPNAIELLEQYQNKTRWDYICLNPNAINLIKKHMEYIQSNNEEYYKINWNLLSSNPSIFEDESMPII